IRADCSSGAGPDISPVGERPVSEWPVIIRLRADSRRSRKRKRLIDIGAPRELNPAAADIGQTHGGVAMDGLLGSEAPLDQIRVLLVELIRSLEPLGTECRNARVADLDVGELEPNLS